MKRRIEDAPPNFIRYQMLIRCRSLAAFCRPSCDSQHRSGRDFSTRDSLRRLPATLSSANPGVLCDFKLRVPQRSGPGQNRNLFLFFSLLTRLRLRRAVAEAKGCAADSAKVGDNDGVARPGEGALTRGTESRGVGKGVDEG